MGYQILEMYIRNESELRAAEIEYNQHREQLYSMTLPQHDDSLGFIVRKVMRVEDIVLDIIELEEHHRLKYGEHYKSRQLKREALQILNNEELEAYNAIVWDSPSSISKPRLKELEQIMLKKLCEYLANK